MEGVAPVEVTAPADPAVQALWVTPRGANGLSGWPVSVAVSDLDEAMEQEPNNEPAKANRIAVPGAITGRFEQKGDLDYYVFAAKKGTRYLIDAQTRELDSPTEVYMTLRDAKNNQIQATDPMKEPHLDYTARGRRRPLLGRRASAILVRPGGGLPPHRGAAFAGLRLVARHRPLQRGPGRFGFHPDLRRPP